MIYEIQTYNLIGKTIEVYKERPDLKIVKGTGGQKDFFVNSEGRKEEYNRHYELVDGLGANKNAISILDFPIYLPYFADVTEDLPARYTFEPKTYKGCQLLTQKHGGYLEFFHHESGETLRIALNSNTYSPVV
jgi:hypothetical protein